jgi:hypothetical protein
MNLGTTLKSITMGENSIPNKLDLPKLDKNKNSAQSFSKSSSLSKDSVHMFKKQSKIAMNSDDTSSIKQTQFFSVMSPSEIAFSKKSASIYDLNSKNESQYDNKSTTTERIKEVNFDEKALSQWSKIKSQMLLPKLNKSTGSDTASQIDRKAKIRFYDNYIRLRTEKHKKDDEEKLKRFDRYEPTYQLGPKIKFNKLEAEFIIKDVFHNSLYLFSTESSEYFILFCISF